MATHEPEGKKIKSVDTAFETIEYLDAVGGAPLSEIVDHIGRSRSTTYYYLKTLQARRYVSKEDDEYRVGLRFLNLGSRTLERTDLHGIGEQEADVLATQRQGVAHIVATTPEKAVVIFQTGDGQREQLEFRMGTEIGLHASAYGKAILANLPEDAQSTYITRDLESCTDRTITSAEGLIEELDSVRELGFAYSENEYREGCCSIAAPIFRGASDVVVGAIGLTKQSGEIEDPTEQYKAQRFMEDLPWQIQRTARAISDRLTEHD